MIHSCLVCVCVSVCVCVFFQHTPILHLHRSVQDHIDIVSTVPMESFGLTRGEEM